MIRRSTNDIGYTHFLGDVTAQVDSSHGARMSGGSTGGIFEAVGDDTNVSVRLRGQGTGGVLLGNSSQGITLAQGSPVVGVYSTTFAYTFTALSSGAYEDFSVASTTAAVDPGDLVSVDLGLPAASTQTMHLLGVRLSTVATSRVTLVLGNVTSTAIGSTGSGTARITWLDLT